MEDGNRRNFPIIATPSIIHSSGLLLSSSRSLSSTRSRRRSGWWRSVCATPMITAAIVAVVSRCRPRPRPRAPPTFVASFSLSTLPSPSPRARASAIGTRRGTWTPASFSTATTTTTTTTTTLWFAAIEDDGYDRTIDSPFDVAGLRKEIDRQVLRCHKKITKANDRLRRVTAEIEELRTNPDVTLEQLEACPDVTFVEDQLRELKERLQKLNELQPLLSKDSSLKLKQSTSVLPPDLATRVVELQLVDCPPTREPRVKKAKPKHDDIGPRLPYRKYFAEDGTEVRLGKRAEDNDELSCSPEHRDGSDWWMHAAGCPGSHVVIRHPDPSEDVLQDAAALAARHSKRGFAGGNSKVSLCRCRDVTKPPGAKPGLVQLRGEVRTLTVKKADAEARLARLDETVKYR